jgi:hypothetical protein
MQLVISFAVQQNHSFSSLFLERSALLGSARLPTPSLNPILQPSSPEVSWH